MHLRPSHFHAQTCLLIAIKTTRIFPSSRDPFLAKLFKPIPAQQANLIRCITFKTWDIYPRSLLNKSWPNQGIFSHCRVALAEPLQTSFTKKLSPSAPFSSPGAEDVAELRPRAGAQHELRRWHCLPGSSICLRSFIIVSKNCLLDNNSLDKKKWLRFIWCGMILYTYICRVRRKGSFLSLAKNTGYRTVICSRSVLFLRFFKIICWIKRRICV